MDQEQTILSGFEYQDKEPYLILDFIETKPIRRLNFFLRNKTFTLEKTENTFCTGSYSLQNMRFNPCPNNARVENGKTMCQSCKKTSGFNPAFYNTEIHSPQQHIYNARPHVVYLANFGTACTKVGIAHRVPRRWLEQGARAATIIKHCNDAYEARELEAGVVAKLRLPEAINGNIKRRLLAKPYSAKTASEELKTTRDLIESSLDFKLEANPIVGLDEYYFASKDTDPLLNTIDITKTNNYISGDFVALVGDTLIMKNGTNNYLLSLKLFISHTITIKENVKESNTTTMSGQSSLF